MNTVQLLQQQVKQAHDWLNTTFGSPAKNDLHFIPGDRINPMGAQYMHVVICEDYFLTRLSGDGPLFANDFADKTGLSEMYPPGEWREWAHAVKIDLDQAQAYANAVFAAVDAYLTKLSDGNLGEEIDFSDVGLGTMTRVQVITTFFIINAITHAGEIAVIKGLRDQQGYPM